MELNGILAEFQMELVLNSEWNSCGIYNGIIVEILMEFLYNF